MNRRKGESVGNTDPALIDTRSAQELEFARVLNNSPDPLVIAARVYELSQAEQLMLLFAVAPFYMGSPHAKLGGTKLSGLAPVVDVDRYARAIIVKRTA